MNRAQHIASALMRLSETVGTYDRPASVGVANAATKAPFHKWKDGADPFNRDALLDVNRIRQQRGEPPLSRGDKIPGRYFAASYHPPLLNTFGHLAASSGRACSAILSTDASDIVVVDADVRPDRNGNASLRDFEERNGIDFPATLSATTPAHGRHLIYRQPSNLLGFPPIKSIIGFLPGVDIKAKGGYVLAPTDGSDGRFWINDAYPVVELPIEIASLLVNTVQKPGSRPAQPQSSRHLPASGEAYFDNAGLARELAKVDPREFREYARWFRFMCACRAVTAGTGLDAFLEWCARDPAYPAHVHAATVAASWNWLGRGGLSG